MALLLVSEIALIPVTNNTKPFILVDTIFAWCFEKFLGSKSSDLLDDVSGLTPSFFAGVRKKAEIFGLLSNKEELESLIKEDVEKIKHQNSLEKYIM